MKSLSAMLHSFIRRPFRRAARGAVHALRQIRSFALFRSSGRVFENRRPFLSSASEDEFRFPKGYCFRELTIENVRAISNLANLAADEVSRRFRVGDRCYGVFWQNMLINTTWIHFSSCYVRGLGIRLDLDDNECYLYGVLTAPSHRRKGLYRCTLVETMRRLESEGIKRIVQIVEKGNDIPMRTIPKFGFRFLGEIRHMRVCRIQWTATYDDERNAISKRFFLRAPHDAFRI